MAALSASKKKHHLSWFGQTIIIIAILFFAFQLFRHFTSTASGNRQDDAILTTMEGKKLSHSQPLNKYLTYQLTYHWQIKNKRRIRNHTKITFELPDNVALNTASLSFPVQDAHHHQVGTFTLERQEQKGTLEFNDYYQRHKITHAQGTLQFSVNGKKEVATTDWFINQVAWIDDDNAPMWSIVCNPKQKKLSHLFITNVCVGNQKYEASSIVLEFGHLNKKGQFKAEETISHPIQKGWIHITGDNQNTIVADLKSTNKTIRITYKTKPTTSGHLNLSNTAVVTCNEHKKATVTAALQLNGASL